MKVDPDERHCRIPHGNFVPYREFGRKRHIETAGARESVKMGTLLRIDKVRWFLPSGDHNPIHVHVELSGHGYTKLNTDPAAPTRRRTKRIPMRMMDDVVRLTEENKEFLKTAIAAQKDEENERNFLV